MTHTHTHADTLDMNMNHIVLPRPCDTNITHHDYCHSSTLTNVLSYLHGAVHVC